MATATPLPVTVNVLIVDDEPHSLVAMQRLLEGPDRNVVAAGSGPDALREVLKMDFALIVLDIRMPGMDGFETAALIRHRRKTRSTPIMFLTAAFDDIESVSRGYQAGAVDYLLKPVDPVVLRAKVGVFIELYTKEAQLAAEVAQRQSAESDVARVNASLEVKIRERTASLTAANEQLRREVEIRRR
ncbi:MAG: response regulator, partial [Betaproteobacteria bacterium]